MHWVTSGLVHRAVSIPGHMCFLGSVTSGPLSHEPYPSLGHMWPRATPHLRVHVTLVSRLKGPLSHSRLINVPILHTLLHQS